MKKPCTACNAFETSRHDDLCPNCAALSLQHSPKTNAAEDLIIRDLGCKCVDCGFDKSLALKLFKDNGGLTGGVACPKNVSQSLTFCLEASGNPAIFKIRCLNCQSRFHRSPGRPPKYATFEERNEAKQIQKAMQRVMQRQAALDYYGTTCVSCDGPPSGLHYIGEPGSSPRRGREWVYAQILRDPEFARQYAPYCEAHRPWTYLERAQRGEVAAPPHWAR